MIYCNNKSGIQLVENLMFHDKSKHYEIRYPYIQDMVQRGAIIPHHILTDEQITNILTKALPKWKFLVFRGNLGLMDVTLSSKGHN